MAEFKDIPVRIDGEIVGTAKGLIDPKTGSVSNVLVEFTSDHEQLSRRFSDIKPGDYSVAKNGNS